MNGEDAAFEAAVKWLVRRGRSEAEVRGRLAGQGFPDEDVERAVERLTRAGYLDDGRLALETVLRDCRRGHGPLRTNERLRALGVSEVVIAEAWEQARADHGVEPRQLLQAQVRRRLPGGDSSCDGATVRRVYNALLRAGFDEASVRAELEPRLPDPASTGDQGS